MPSTLRLIIQDQSIRADRGMRRPKRRRDRYAVDLGQGGRVDPDPLHTKIAGLTVPGQDRAA